MIIYYDKYEGVHNTIRYVRIDYSNKEEEFVEAVIYLMKERGWDFDLYTFGGESSYAYCDVYDNKDGFMYDWEECEEEVNQM